MDTTFPLSKLLWLQCPPATSQTCQTLRAYRWQTHTRLWRHSRQRRRIHHASLVLDERARRADVTLVDAVPTAPGPRSRLVGELLRLGLVTEAQREARSLARLAPNDRLSHFQIEEAKIQSRLGEPERRLRVSRMPVFSPAMANMLRRLQASPDPLVDPTHGSHAILNEQ